MLLHDSFFFSVNKSLNRTHYTSYIMAHSPLFHSTLTLVLSIFGTCANLICLFYLCHLQYQRQKDKQNKTNVDSKQSLHVLSKKKYRFLILLIGNDSLICFSSIISCIDQKYYSQSLIAHYHLCSFHILIWKFTLHFTPILTIFILLRYLYMLKRHFPQKNSNLTTLDQFFCTDLCTLISFVIALAWSVDGLWLWGETNLKAFITPTATTDDLDSNSSRLIDTKTKHQQNKSTGNHVPFTEQQLICYLQTNNNIDFTTRLLHLIQADFVLLFLFHCLGFLLEIILHLRLSCCLVTRKITTFFLHEQQLSLYILYLFLFLTLTSLPFYFYRIIEIFFDIQVLSQQNDTINSRILAQIILCGVSFKPVLYVLLFVPKNVLFQWRCYTSIRIDNQHSDRSNGHSPRQTRISFNLRTLSTPDIFRQNTVDSAEF